MYVRKKKICKRDICVILTKKYYISAQKLPIWNYKTFFRHHFKSILLFLIFFFSQ